MDAESVAKAFDNFMKCWIGADWGLMEKYCGKTWMVIVPDPKEMLRAIFRFKLFGYSIQKIEFANDTSAKITVIIEYEIARATRKAMVNEVMATKELAPYVPSVEGEWGISPSSFMVV